MFTDPGRGCQIRDLRIHDLIQTPVFLQQTLRHGLHIAPRHGVGKEQLQDLIIHERIRSGKQIFFPQTLPVSDPAIRFFRHGQTFLRRTVMVSKWAVAGNRSKS